MTDQKQKAALRYKLIVLRKQKKAHINAVSVSLCLISWVFFVFYSYLHQQFANALFPASFLIPLLALAPAILPGKKQPLPVHLPLLTTAVVWLLVPGMRWIALVFILFMVMDRRARQPLTVAISDEGIVVHTFFKKKYGWEAFTNVMLRDGLLTLDFMNNRITQREVQPESGDIDEAAFNAYCREQLQNRNH